MPSAAVPIDSRVLNEALSAHRDEMLSAIASNIALLLFIFINVGPYNHYICMFSFVCEIDIAHVESNIK